MSLTFFVLPICVLLDIVFSIFTSPCFDRDNRLGRLNLMRHGMKSLIVTTSSTLDLTLDDNAT